MTRQMTVTTGATAGAVTGGAGITPTASSSARRPRGVRRPCAAKPRRSGRPVALQCVRGRSVGNSFARNRSFTGRHVSISEQLFLAPSVDRKGGLSVPLLCCKHLPRSGCLSRQLARSALRGCIPL